MAYDRSGTQLWAARYGAGDGENPTGRHVAVDDRRSVVYVSADVTPGTRTISDIVLLAYSVTGQQLWAKRYAGPAGGSDKAGEIALDPATGCIFLVGTSDGGSTGNDYVTLAYSPTGEQLWVARYDGPVGGDDIGERIEFAAGQVYVSGWSDGGDTGDDFATIAYSRAGSQLWVSRYKQRCGRRRQPG